MNAMCIVLNETIDPSEIEGNRYKQRKSTHPCLRVDRYDVFTKNF